MRRILCAGLLFSAIASVSACETARTDPLDQALNRATQAHFERVLDRLALREDADAQLLRLWLLSSRGLSEHLQCAPDPAQRDAREAALQQAREPWAIAVLAAPDLQPQHALALAATLLPSSPARQQALDSLLVSMPDNPIVLAYQLQDPRYAPTASELDARLAAVAAAARPSQMGWTFSQTLLVNAALSVAADPELVHLSYQAMQPKDPAWQQASPTVLAEIAAAMPAVGYLMALSLPTFQSLVDACHPARQAEFSAEREAACDAIGRGMAAQAETVLDQRIGLAIWRRMVERRGDSLDEVDAALRESQWQMVQASALRFADVGPEATQRSLQAWRSGRSELDINRTVLQQAGVALTPPSDWTLEAYRASTDAAPAARP